MPDLMKAMLEQKIGHPKAGANTAWVPSPTGATLHALHYHQVNVASVQAELEKISADTERANILADLLQVPVAKNPQVERGREAAGAGQQRPGHPGLRGALGRPGRGLLQGAGHPRHGPDGRPRHAAHLQPAHSQLAAARHRQRADRCATRFARMAAKVDQQNAGDPLYQRMAGRYAQPAPPTKPRCDLVFKGVAQPSGYTEPLLHAWRLKVKAAAQ